MAYTLVNLVTFLLGTVFLYNGYRLVKSGKEDVPVFLLSSAIGLGLMVVAVFPDAFALVATFIGLELKARAILVVSNLTLFALVIYLLNRIGELSRRVSRLNEELSLLGVERDDKSDGE